MTILGLILMFPFLVLFNAVLYGIYFFHDTPEKGMTEARFLLALGFINVLGEVGLFLIIKGGL